MVTARLGQLELPLLSDVRCVLNACEGEALYSPSNIPDGFGYSSNGVGGFLPRGGSVAAFHSCDAHLMKRLLPEKPTAVGGLAQHGIHEYRKS